MENFKSEQIDLLVLSVVETIKSIVNIDKNSEVGEGKNKYNGVSDKDVKDKVGKAMAAQGLCLLPIEVDEVTDVKSYTDQYGNQKQRVFVKVKSRYLLSHISGQYVILTGIGHGIDSQDKGAGKATTYAMKYMMLYTFVVATGSIDDADNTHSDNIETPPAPADPVPPAPKLEYMTLNHVDYQTVLNAIKTGTRTIEDARKKYTLSKEVEAILTSLNKK